MDSRVRLAVQIAIVVVIILAGVLTARGVGNMAAKKLIEMTPYQTSTSAASSTGTEATDVSEDTTDGLLYNRNLFNQHAGQGDEEEVSKSEEVEPIPEEIQEIAVDGRRPILTDLRVLLKGTQVASDPTYSVAMFMPLEETDAKMQYLHEGEELLSEARVLSIVRNRVYMIRHTQGDRLEYIDTRTTEDDLNEAKKVIEKLKVVETKPAETKTASATGSATKAEVSADVIKKVGADTYELPRATVEAIRDNPNILKQPQYGAMPKVQPVYKGGNVNGFRLLGVESDSIYAQLGLKSGDIILDVNGQQIDNPQKAMSLFDALGANQDVLLKVNRAGAEKTLTFQLK